MPKVTVLRLKQHTNSPVEPTVTPVLLKQRSNWPCGQEEVYDAAKSHGVNAESHCFVVSQ